MPQTISFKYHRQTIARLREYYKAKLAKVEASAKEKAIKKVTPRNGFIKKLWEAWLAVERFITNKKYN